MFASTLTHWDYFWIWQTDVYPNHPCSLLYAFNVLCNGDLIHHNSMGGDAQLIVAFY